MIARMIIKLTMLPALPSKSLIFSQLSSSSCLSDILNISIRNLSKFKNTFAYEKDFQNAYNRMNGNSRNKVISSDIVSGKKKNDRPKETNKLPTLQYKGEILFGIHPVYMALLKERRKLHQLFIRTESDDRTENNVDSRKTEILKIAMSLGISVHNINTQGLKYLVPGAVHQGVCLDAGPLPLFNWTETDNIQDSSKDMPLWLVLDEILDPMNVGAIIRSAYYFGVRKLFVVKGNSCKLSPTVSKASSGALEVMDVHQIENLEYFIQTMKTKEWTIISTLAYCEEEGKSVRAVDATEFKLKGPTILILGNEGRGISSSIQALCDSFISIYPSQNLHKGIDSLNVSVASGVILYSLSKSWKDCLK